jgi:hypothetical protein
MNTVVKFRAPKFKPLPTELTPASIREAILPAKIVAMSRAVAACRELPELLNYKKTIDGLAAAARTIQHEIPEQVAMLNRTAKEAMIKMGELLLQYRGDVDANSYPGQRGFTKDKGTRLSERHQVAKSLGIPPRIVAATTRVASSPARAIDLVLSSASPSFQQSVRENSSRIPPLKKSSSKVPYSDAMIEVCGAGTRLAHAVLCLRHTPLEPFARLTAPERVTVKAKITEAQELLDAMLQRLERSEMVAA